MERLSRKSIAFSEHGETLLSFLVGSFVSAVVLAAALQSYFDSSHRAFDHKVISETRENAKSILDLMTFDLRMTGSGMPLNQANFQIGGTGLSTAPDPILTSATATSITLRRNLRGVSSVLTAAYTPSASSLTFSVLSGSDFGAGDTVYISDAAVGGGNGFKGTVTSAGSSSVTVSSAITASAAATFPIGSVVERVTPVTYSSPLDESGIGRDAGEGVVFLSPKTTFSLRYFDDTGTELVLPLTQTVLKDKLSAIEVTATVVSRKPLHSGSFYTAQVRQRVGLRNLYLSR